MVKASKFAALADFRQTPDAEPEITEVPAPTPKAPDEAPPRTTTPTARPRGRPPGKRSDPEWKLFSHFLKRTTQRQAAALLFEADDGRDLSDVLQTLLEKWVARQQAKS